MSAAAFGVPPHMVGDSTKQSYASAEQADLEFTKHTLGTWASRLEEECTRKLVRAVLQKYYVLCKTQQRQV